MLVAEPDAWFTYYYWLDDARCARLRPGVEIHKKPGYDPAELFLDPEDRWVKLRAAATLARKKAGLRYAMNVVPLDPAPVRGSHGRLPEDPPKGRSCSAPTRLPARPVRSDRGPRPAWPAAHIRRAA